ncbi:hypothetical protein COV18_04250 [Candidatus Woesearchaeota archaeon CG10_big_fil_rev_8_21_14_0_10_37_12]|nr:MAG: hypothetical protein COV18_04250 [Candidatus Woesearchaeota archaeon CG10_big_fil_rev_8_21_14_0_10_37_12]
MATVLGNVLIFFKQLGVYDVLLPFLLVFTVMFAILERTKLFGTEGGSDNKKYTKKNLNAMVSFVVAFLVIASSKLVETITKVSSEIVVLLMLIVFFLMMVGTFYSSADIDKEGITLTGIWKHGFMVVIAITLIFIFLDAIETDSGVTWLEVFWNWLSGFYTNTSVAAILLIIGVILYMVWMMQFKE